MILLINIAIRYVKRSLMEALENAGTASNAFFADPAPAVVIMERPGLGGDGRLFPPLCERSLPAR
jgi:hypothetical protein